jgi:hypothetical protein
MTVVTTIIGQLRHLRVLGWAEDSQLGSRRNALVAATALAESRRQHCEVEEFLAWHTRQSSEGLRSPRTAGSASGI